MANDLAVPIAATLVVAALLSNMQRQGMLLSYVRESHKFLRRRIVRWTADLTGAFLRERDATGRRLARVEDKVDKLENQVSGS
jgi:hypothetical protein